MGIVIGNMKMSPQERASTWISILQMKKAIRVLKERKSERYQTQLSGDKATLRALFREYLAA